MLALDALGFGGPAMVVAGLFPGAGKACQADVIVGIFAAQFQRPHMLVDEMPRL